VKLTLKERFFAKVSPEPTTGCWLWKGYLNPGGYGVISMPGSPKRGIADKTCDSNPRPNYAL